MNADILATTSLVSSSENCRGLDCGVGRRKAKRAKPYQPLALNSSLVQLRSGLDYS